MIPKIIHYCWFGGNPLPNAYKEFMASWKKFMPDYEIVEWNENNFDVSENKYCSQAYKSKKWAFVSDYARLKVIYKYGGIYLDTDVELIKSLAPLVQDGVGFIGFQNAYEATTGLGFAAPKENMCVKEMLGIYKYINFLKKDGSFDLTPCPVTNTVALKSLGLKIGLPHSLKMQSLYGMHILPVDYLNPLNPDTLQLKITVNTFTIHHYSASWVTKKQQYKHLIKKILPNAFLEKRIEYICKRDIKRMEQELRIIKEHNIAAPPPLEQ